MIDSYGGKNILITGASSGIGAEFARQLHSLGANLILVARRKERLEQMTSQYNFLKPDSCQFWQADLSIPEDLQVIKYKIAETKIDVFINNAGVGSFGHKEKIEEHYEDQIIKLNVQATSALLHAVIPQMKERKSGSIINVSSVAGFQPMPYMATYSASKAFNLNQSIALYSELSEFGIKVIALCPGPTETEFFGVAKMAASPVQMQKDNVEEVVKETLNALWKKRPYVVTGNRSKLMAFASMVLPYSLTTFFVKRDLRKYLRA